jgi:hypothetical protein
MEEKKRGGEKKEHWYLYLKTSICSTLIAISIFSWDCPVIQSRLLMCYAGYHSLDERVSKD